MKCKYCKNFQGINVIEVDGQRVGILKCQELGKIQYNPEEGWDDDIPNVEKCPSDFASDFVFEKGDKVRRKQGKKVGTVIRATNDGRISVEWSETYKKSLDHPSWYVKVDSNSEGEE